jgi:ComF family protein
MYSMLRTIAFLQKAKLLLLKIFFPDFCIGCECFDIPLCNSCESKLTLSHKQLSPFSFSVYDYSDPLVKDLVKSIKYHNDINLAREISKNFLDKLKLIQMISQKRNLILIPIPIHISRLKSRGYNQSSVLAQSIARTLNSKILTENCTQLIYADILIKNKSTDNMYKEENISGRLRNIEYSISVNSMALKNIHLEIPIAKNNAAYILIDDVTTTGATIYEARRALFNQNDAECIVLMSDIYALTLAN